MDDLPETSEYRQLVEQLGHPQTRRVARQRLVAGGAVGPLLECLGSANESVVWSAVQSLGELRAAEAVLRKNLSIPAGALAIRDVGGKPNFVMVDTMLAAVVTPSTLAKRIENIARRADSIERVLTQADRR